MNKKVRVKEGAFSIFARRFRAHRLAFFSLIILLTLIVLSLGAPFIEYALGVSHTKAILFDINLGPSWPHILGTNELGQDVFTRLLFGGRISLSIGIISAMASAIIGTLIGLWAGFYGGKVDALLMRFTDAMLAIPVLPLMIVFAGLDLGLLASWNFSSHIYLIIIAFVAIYLILRLLMDERRQKTLIAYIIRLGIDGLLVALGLIVAYWLFFSIPGKFLEGNFASVIKLILIIVFFGWMSVARLARASALQIKESDFIMAAKSLGATNRRILWAHIFPNALAPIVVAATLEVGANILYEAALSFLGLGIQPPVSSWGNMLNNAVDYIKIAPSLAFWPGALILLTVSCFNFLGDGLRDALDPYRLLKTRKTKV